mmetsp:Transcript_15742/g.33255  ORF Transcript_15742/g.33255 Transcript_15742/m.33255 type:complete len:433 (+) Transcript_15742:133-1431(+)
MITTRVLGSGVIGGQVFYDNDGDGMRDANTHINGVVDVSVWLFSCSPFKPLASQKTASNGIYRFRDLARGSYYIVAEPPTGYQFSASGMIDDPSSGIVLDSTIDPRSWRGICFELKEGEKTMGWSFGLWRPSSDGPSVQPSTLSTHSNGPTLKISINDPSMVPSRGPSHHPSGSPITANPTLIGVTSHEPSGRLAESILTYYSATTGSLNPTLKHSQFRPSGIPTPNATPNSVRTIDSSTATVANAPGKLSDFIPTNSPATTDNLNPASNHSLDPLQFSSLSIVSNPAPTIDSPSRTVTKIVSTLSNKSRPSKTEPPSYSPSSELSTGSIGNNVLSQTSFPTSSAPDWDSLSFIDITKTDKNNNSDNNTTGNIIVVAFLLIVLTLGLISLAVLRKRKIIRCFVVGNRIGTEALPTTLSREQSDQEDSGSGIM